jgi:hypothetical protein
MDLNLDLVIDIAPINPAKGSYDLINDLLQANRTSTDLETLRQRAMDENSGWTLCNRLLLFEDRLVVPKDDDLKVRLLSKVYN